MIAPQSLQIGIPDYHPSLARLLQPPTGKKKKASSANNEALLSSGPPRLGDGVGPCSYRVDFESGGVNEKSMLLRQTSATVASAASRTSISRTIGVSPVSSSYSRA